LNETKGSGINESGSSSGINESSGLEIPGIKVPLEVKIPADLGFDPIKFPDYRLNQLEVAKQDSTTKKQLFLLEAPTGSGKSLAGMTSTRLQGLERSVYLVATKQLQDQIVNDFHIPVLKGRGNYPCLNFANQYPDITSEICSEYKEVRGGCHYSNNCPYSEAKKAALSAPCCILNYPLFFSEANYVGGFSGVNELIMDEVDVVEDQLMSFIEVKITKKIVERYKLGLPKFKTKLEAWKDWADQSAGTIGAEIEAITEEQMVRFSALQMKEFTRLKRIHRKLGFLSSNLDDSWVMELEDDPKSLTLVSFKPVIVSKYAKSYLWKHTTHALGMSATILGPSAMAMDFGLHSWDQESASIPSPFPIESRMVKFVPVANVVRDNMDKAEIELMDYINKTLIPRHSKEKILIHAVNYNLANFLYDNLHSDTHVFFKHGKLDRATQLEDFKAVQKPAIMISPSMERGVDLPGDLCRVVIVAKVPYPSLGSPQVAKRIHTGSDGSLWYARRTIRSLIQMTGRGTRYLGDYSVNYILDQQFANLFDKRKEIFPRWWVDALVKSDL
jgi:Rad3-related DNA helicase